MDFLQSNYISIIIVVVIVIGIIIILQMFNINLNPAPISTKIIPIATIETMDNYDSIMMSPDKSFCKLYEGQSHHLEGACAGLTETNCKSSSCCGWLDGKKCVAGSANGPTYNSDSSGKTLPIDTYYYMNKCYGLGCRQ
jgi:hypothetical protein